MSSNLIDVNAESLELLVEKTDIVLVDFWASWCVPCKAFAVVYENLAKENPKLIFAKVNVEKEEDLAKIFHIRSIPHLLIFKKGEVVYSEAGNLPEHGLRELINQALTV